MKLWQKALCVAGALIGVGSVFAVSAVAVAGGDYRELGSTKYTAKSKEITESFTSVSIATDAHEVVVLPSADGRCRVDYHEAKSIVYEVKVENGTLSIIEQDSRRWYEQIGFFFGDIKTKVYLPKGTYENLSVSVESGDVDLMTGLSYTDVSVKTNSGSVDIQSEITGNLRVEVDSGDVEATGLKLQSVSVVASSGDVDLERIEATSVSVSVRSGEISFESVVTAGKTEVFASSGEIELEACDAGEYVIKTGSGNVEATLLSGKVFDARTGSGRVRVPVSTSGGNCKVTTGSGDIRISVIG